MTASTGNSQKAYNVVAHQLTAAEESTTASGKPSVKFRAKLTVGGREIERTVIAQGASAELLDGKLKQGEDISLRVLFKRAPANENGRGGEYLSVVALPKTKAAA